MSGHALCGEVWCQSCSQLCSYLFFAFLGFLTKNFKAHQEAVLGFIKSVQSGTRTMQVRQMEAGRQTARADTYALCLSD